MALLQRFRTACASSGAGTDILQTKGDVFFPASRALNFDAAVHGYQSRKFRIVQFDSLQRTQCPFDEKSFRAKLKRL